MAIMPLSYSWKGPTSLELDAFLCFSDSYLSVGAEKLEKRQRSFELDVSFHSASSNSIVTKNKWPTSESHDADSLIDW